MWNVTLECTTTGYPFSCLGSEPIKKSFPDHPHTPANSFFNYFTFLPQIIEKTNEVSQVIVSKIPRETTRFATFIFYELDWSKWELISTTREAACTCGDWEPRRSGVGRQRATLYGGDTKRPTIYEIAVRPCDVTGAKMTVVYFRKTMRYANKQGGNFDKGLFRLDGWFWNTMSCLTIEAL